MEGLSLQSQQLTAAYLGLRLVSSAAFEGNPHTFLDAVTLACTLGVVAMMRGSLRRTYDPKLDMDASAALKYVLAPCVVLGLLVNPGVVERVPDDVARHARRAARQKPARESLRLPPCSWRAARACGPLARPNRFPRLHQQARSPTLHYIDAE